MNAVIFDNDGVLVDSEPLHRVAWEQTFGPRGVVVSEEDYAWSIGRRDLLFAERIIDKAAMDETAEGIRDEKHAHLRRLLATESRPFPGGPELVRALAKTYVLAVTSSAMRTEIGIVLDRLGLDDVFETFVTNEDVSRHKPDPEPYVLCAERLGVRPEHCVVFEDSVTGIEAAVAAGMHVIGFTSTFPREALSAADVVVDSLADTEALAALVASLLQ
jgi:beta-phosphoglucomutase